MVRIDALDESNYLLLTDVFLPEQEALQRGLPQCPEPYVGTRYDFASREQATAWVLSAYARRLVALSHEREFGDQRATAFTLPFETWILQPPSHEAAALTEGFAAESAHTDYRLVIHRSPRYTDGVPAPVPWRNMHSYHASGHRSAGQLSFRHKQDAGGRLKRAARPFLEALLAAYQGGPAEVLKLVEGCGHPYAHSDGLPRR
jgi:hypothetical protein